MYPPLGHSYLEADFKVAFSLAAVERIVLGPSAPGKGISRMDIGCGKGLLAMQIHQLLRNTGSHVSIGVDVTESLVQSARFLRELFRTAEDDFCSRVSFIVSFSAFLFLPCDRLVCTDDTCFTCLCRFPFIVLTRGILNHLKAWMLRTFYGVHVSRNGLFQPFTGR